MTARHIPRLRPRVEREHQDPFATGPGELLLHRAQVTAGLSGRPEFDHGLALEDCGGFRLAALAADQEHPVRAELPEAAAEEHDVGGARRLALRVAGAAPAANGRGKKQNFRARPPNFSRSVEAPTFATGAGAGQSLSIPNSLCREPALPTRSLRGLEPAHAPEDCRLTR